MRENPISDSSPIYIRSIESKRIVRSYKDSFGIDVRKYFRGIPVVYVFQDTSSQYRYFYPFTCAGNGTLYKQLERKPWYYMKWKWEYDKTLSWIKKKDRVLEIGCGRGYFLEKLREQKISCTGLEINRQAGLELKKKGIPHSISSLSDYAKSTKAKFSIIICFQLLEHIADVRSFFLAIQKLLSKNGKLILSVPDNDSFLQYDPNNPLLLPPHHMGLWTDTALQKVASKFCLQKIWSKREPLQRYHYSYYAYVMTKYFFRKGKLNFLHSLRLHIFVQNLICRYLWANEKFIGKEIGGHTLMIVFEKR